MPSHSLAISPARVALEPHVPLEIITPDAVRSALRALRYVNKPYRSPLLDLDLVSLRMRDEDVADTHQARSWILGRCLWDAVETKLLRLRDGQNGPAMALPSAEVEFALLQEDLRSGSSERLDWALMRWRYLAPTHQTVRELARALGLSERTLQNRVARGEAGLTDLLRREEVEASRRLAALTGVPVAERVVIDEQAAPKGVMEVLGELQGLVSMHRATVRTTPAQLQAAASHPVAELTTYRLGRIAEWSQPRYRLDSRFVELSLLVDLGEESQSGRWQAREERFTDLRDVLAAVSEPAVVLLGPPGSGKSTLLRRLELDLACDALSTNGAGHDEGNSPSIVLTFLVSLNQYRPPAPGAPLPPPGEWLAERWSARYPQLPPLADVAAHHPMVYLLDGLNELPHRSAEEYRARIALWKQFLHETVTPGSGHRAVIACRSLDYSAPLSTPTMRVPQVQMEPLTDEKVEAFLRRYSPEHAAALWEQLRATAVLGAMRWPFFLRLLVEAAAESGRWEGDLAGLFTAYVRRALVREVERHNPRLEPNGLLDERDYERVVSGRGWRHRYELPERGALFLALSELAHGMQEAAVEGESSQVRIGYAAAVEMVSGGRSDDGRRDGQGAGDGGERTSRALEGERGQVGEVVIRIGEELGLLDEDRAADEVMFQHQLLQEYFAARKMAREPRLQPVRQAWRAAEIRPPLREILDSLPQAETLPALPTTGWEETVLMAAAMADQPEAFILGVMPMNLALAGRAANLPTVRPRLGAAFLGELRWALVHRSRDKDADLRARIEAGLELGHLGDPRFEWREGPHGAYIIPPMVEIPGGEYPIGDDEPIFDVVSNSEDRAHMPRHVVNLKTFSIGRFAVTNAEYACFLAAGGYEEERWWATEGARAWRSGQGTAEPMKRGVIRGLQTIKSTPGLLESWHDIGLVDDEQYKRWERRLAMSEGELEAHLAELYPGGREMEPRFWHDERYNNPAQPVVGVSWFEAMAYCAWLRAQTGQGWRLPNEAEREAATRGADGRLYAYGDETDALKANTAECHLLRPSPVGVFVEGDTPEGLSDLTGNTSDWTMSRWGPDENEPKYTYPYDSADGREETSADGRCLRIARGGYWSNHRNSARAAFRLQGLPSDRGHGYGFRVVVVGSPQLTGTPASIAATWSAGGGA